MPLPNKARLGIAQDADKREKAVKIAADAFAKLERHRTELQENSKDRTKKLKKMAEGIRCGAGVRGAGNLSFTHLMGGLQSQPECEGLFDDREGAFFAAQNIFDNAGEDINSSARRRCI